MLQEVLQGLEKSLSTELTKLTNNFYHAAKKRIFQLSLQVIVFSAASIFLITGFVLFASRYSPLEYVLMLFGAGLFLALLAMTK